MKKLLLVGNHTCGNRGDGAILRGIVEYVESRWPGSELTITSRYPVSSTYLLGRRVVADPLHTWRSSLGKRYGKLGARCAGQLFTIALLVAVRLRIAWLVRLLPRIAQEQVRAMAQYDAVLQVGGAFFVDLYGHAQYDMPFLALAAGRPLYLIGHSLGPFQTRMSRLQIGTLLRGASATILREPATRSLLESMNLPMDRVCNGSDTAWLVHPQTGNAYWPAILASRQAIRPVVAITLRELAPFDRRLQVTQEAYEQAFAKLADAVIDAGYDVVAASTCTGIDSYPRDDRMNALRIGNLIRNRDHFHVLMDEMNDIELGQFFSACSLVVGTRLHSAIIAMNFGTPAIVVNYEHKSEGVMQQLGFPEFSRPVASLTSGNLASLVLAILPTLDALRTRIATAVGEERRVAARAIDACLASILK